METILLVDNDPGFRKAAETVLAGEGFAIHTANTLEESRRLGGRKQYQLVLAGLRLPDGEGLEVLRWFSRQSPHTPVIMIAALGELPTAIEVLKQGAAGYVSRPLTTLDELRLVVRRTVETSQVKREREALWEQEQARFSPHDLIALDPVMAETLELARKAASTQAPVLLTGQPGTGKELLARCIHAGSGSAGRAFVSVHCGGQPHGLIERQLFGHQTGESVHVGRIEWAQGGTLYLDEVSELDLSVQLKLLRAIRQRTFERPGGAREITADVRLIAATSHDLRKMVAEHKFREDLYYALSASSLEIPRLQERPADIPALARLFLSRAAADMGKPEMELSVEALGALVAHDWPGNVRELKNMMDRVAMLGNGHVSRPDLPLPQPNGSGAQPWMEIERQAIEEALRTNHGNRTRAARQLGFSLRKLQYRLKAYGVQAN